MPFRAAGNELAEHVVEPVHGGDPLGDDLLTAGGEQAQDLHAVVLVNHLQVPGPQAGNGDREGVGVVGLAAAATTQRADPGREPRGHVEYRLSLGDQPLRQAGTHPAGTFDRPDAVAVDAGERFHRPVAGLVVGEPLLGQHLLALVDDDQRVARLVRIDPDHNPAHRHTLQLEERPGGQSYFRRSAPLLSQSQPATPGEGSTPLICAVVPAAKVSLCQELPRPASRHLTWTVLIPSLRRTRRTSCAISIPHAPRGSPALHLRPGESVPAVTEGTPVIPR